MCAVETKDQISYFDSSLFLYASTDKRGIIRSGNELFWQVSGYSGEELVGAPHNIVRHPDMPRVVFQTFWSHLQSDRMVSAYVKNRTKDGRYYWAFATGISTEQGYISLLAGANSRFLNLAKTLYAELRAAEGPQPEPEAEAVRLTAALRRIGFRDYDAFMAAAAAAELEAHSAMGGQAQEIAPLVKMCEQLGRLWTAQDELLATFSTLYLVPTNMRILASRMEPSGGPVSAIADSYKRTASELTARLRGTSARHAGAPRDLLSMVDGALYGAATTRIATSACDQVARECGLGGAPLADELAFVGTHCARIADENQEHLETVMLQLRKLQREAEAISQLMSGLEQVRILGEVESGRLRQHDGGLAAIMGQLHDFHGRIRSRLNSMISLSHEMGTASETVCRPPSAQRGLRPTA